MCGGLVARKFPLFSFLNGTTGVQLSVGWHSQLLFSSHGFMGVLPPSIPRDSFQYFLKELEGGGPSFYDLIVA